MRGNRSLVAFVFVVLLVPALAAATRDEPAIRIGYVTFDKTPGPSQEHVVRYLQAVTAAARGRSPARFQIYSGNYYQVMSWLGSGDLDGAVLSPFMTFIALRRFQDAHPVVDLAGSHTAAVEGGVRPAMVAIEKSGGKSITLTNPVRLYDDFIRSLLRTAEVPTYEEEALRPYAVNLVNHLSTSGFILPLIYTHERVEILAREEVAPQDDRDLLRKLDRFWNLFFQYTRLSLVHGAGDYDGVTEFRFVYPTDGVDQAQPYLDDWTSAPNPNDTLVLRENELSPACAAIHALLRMGEAAVRAQGTQLDPVPELAAEPGSVFREAAAALDEKWSDRWPVPIVKPDKLRDGYFTATAYNFEMHEQFAKRVSDLFGLNGSPEHCSMMLNVFWKKWYEAGQYPFMADELLSLIAIDGKMRDGARPGPTRVALVLPGGGVRGTYQAALLDRLYENRLLANERDRRAAASRVIVQQVIGTSGGAIVGYFAAQRIARVRDILRRQWVRDGTVIATPLAVFPLVGILRWVSILAVFAIFAAISALTFRKTLIVRVPDGDLPIVIPLAVVFAIFLGPFLLWHLASVKQDYTPTWEGLLYLVVIIAAHFLITTTGGRKRHDAARRWNVLAWLLAITATALVVFIFVRDDARVLTNGIGLQSWLAFCALLAILSAACTYAHSRGLANPPAMAAYLWAVVAAIVVVIGAFLVLSGGIAAGAASSLELTWEYWIWVAAGGVIVATAACAHVELFKGSRINVHLREAVTFWSEVHAKRRLLRTPAESMISLCGLGLLFWMIFAAPGLYSASEGTKTFEQSVEDFNHGHDAFLADFVVTATSLGAELNGIGMNSYKEGDYYCCLAPQAGCQRMSSLQQQRVIAFADSPHFRGAVLASGSPFPIFPARRVDRDMLHAGMFIDGGYTHNTPIEAAQVLGASDVLIVHSAQRIDPVRKPRRNVSDRRFGALASDAAGLFPFLFERSQAIDQEVRAHMFVASLAPMPEGGHQDAFLMDFRDSTVLELDAAANRDFRRHRIGQVESWGMPTRLIRDTGIGCP